MPRDDVAYYRIREQQELAAADGAADSSCRRVHVELARLYAERINEVSMDDLAISGIVMAKIP
jgi:hypothetical protein